MGGGNRIRRICNAMAVANASFGKRCSIQQSRKYGSPRNFFGGTGPRTITMALEANWSSHPVFSRASCGARSAPSRGMKRDTAATLSSETPHQRLRANCSDSLRKYTPPACFPTRGAIAGTNGLPFATRFATIGLPFGRRKGKYKDGSPRNVSSYGDDKFFDSNGPRFSAFPMGQDCIGVFVVLLLIALALPYFLDVDRYRDTIADAHREADRPQGHHWKNARAILAGCRIDCRRPARWQPRRDFRRAMFSRRMKSE